MVLHLKTAWCDRRTLGRQVEGRAKGSLGLGRWEWKGSGRDGAWALAACLRAVATGANSQVPGSRN